MFMKDVVIKGNAPAVPGPIAIFGSVGINRQGGVREGGLGAGLSLEPIDSKDRDGWTVAGGRIAFRSWRWKSL